MLQTRSKQVKREPWSYCVQHDPEHSSNKIIWAGSISSAAIQNWDCSMAYCAACDPEHSPSSQIVQTALFNKIDDHKSLKQVTK